MPYDSFSLVRDANVTLIPAGDTVVLPAGTSVEVTQSLGQAITLRTQTGLFRLEGSDVDALGPGASDLIDSTTASTVKREGPFGEDHIWDALRSCFDPEIPVNIVDLGLIYDLQIKSLPDSHLSNVEVKMTLTAQGCGMGPVIAEDAKSKIEALPEVDTAKVEIVWDPPWNPHMISPEGRKKLGLD